MKSREVCPGDKAIWILYFFVPIGINVLKMFQAVRVCSSTQSRFLPAFDNSDLQNKIKVFSAPHRRYAEKAGSCSN